MPTAAVATAAARSLRALHAGRPPPPRAAVAGTACAVLPELAHVIVALVEVKHRAERTR